MTERKPPAATFETWIDRQVREAIDRGEFDNLPGAGKPIPGIDEPYDEMWWVKQKLRRENISVLPPTLALRKEAEDELRAAATANSEVQARRIVTAVNEKIRAAIRTPLPGPPLNLMPFDVDRVVERWRLDHPDDTTVRTPDNEAPAARPAGADLSTSWWQRFARRLSAAGRRLEPRRSGR